MINPWSKDGWNISNQGQVVKRRGLAYATALAREAGVELGATRPAEVQPTKIVERRNFILNKRIEGGGGGRGYSGDGPPGESV